MFCRIIDLINPIILIILILDNKPTIKWPAIILAANRIDKVKGRIKWLILSIITINGDNNKGLPSGTKWAAVILKFLNQPIIKNDNQKTNPKPKVTTGWAVEVKIKGNKPNIFLNTKYKNVTTEIKFNAKWLGKDTSLKIFLTWKNKILKITK